MNFRRPASLSVLVFLVLYGLSAAGSPAGIGGPYGEYEMAYQGPETLTLLVVPDGSGHSFDQAFLPYGGYEDATITLHLKDANWDPVPSFPREDMWLESADGGLAACAGGSIADTNTDAGGVTRWVNPPRAGGYSQAQTWVLVNGGPIELTSPLDLNFNSPDINGDRTVNLTDVQIFTVDFYGGYDFRSDFFRDGIVNLSDLAKLSYAFGAGCP